MIGQNVRQVLAELPDGVQLVAAVKTRQPAEIMEAIEAGVSIIGDNYVQDAEKIYPVIGDRLKWHFLGHLQKNKVKRAVRIFDVVETVDSVGIAREIDKRCAQIGKIMLILIEVNSGREEQKSGVLPEDVEPLVKEISTLANIRVEGLMTMGPSSVDPEELRPYFKATREIFAEIRRLNLHNVDMKYLSMGMTSSYRIAIEEGANIIRLGDRIFGYKDYQRIEPMNGDPDTERNECQPESKGRK
ncbi:MAG: YggS family pyridoxal phosphate-dependent enzyme [Dehalococcoidales bacterium]|nr:MAG: YggS family pyridoxal phosphate-dependent enzyme [Dehalococcoidales bacterium]